MTNVQIEPDRQIEPPKRSKFDLGLPFWLRLAGLALLDALALYAFIVFIGNSDWPIALILVALTLAINWVYLSPGTGALRWITPGLSFLLVFLIIPIIFTAFISVTNWSTGNALTKPQAIEVLEQRPYIDPEAEAVVFDLIVYQAGPGEFLWVLVGDDGTTIAGLPRPKSELPEEDADGTIDLTEYDVVDEDGDGIPEQIDDYQRVSGPALFQVANELQNWALDLPGGEAAPIGTDRARVVQGAQRYTYDEDADALFDRQTDQVCPADGDVGAFICPDGTSIEPGWRVFTGVENYRDIFTNERIRGPFFRVFAWNVAFALGSVLFTFGLGLALAITFQHERMRGRTFYRSIYILPYAIPAFLSIIIWRGLLNTNFGQVNDFLATFGIPAVPWLTDPNWAKVALLMVNTWLGFTYMYLISTGALQSIPHDLQEAARVDGASGWQVFRKITFPLLMVSLAPLLIGSFAFNFNNFVMVELLTQGGPPVLDAAVPIGHTDILITFTFNVAVSAGRGNQFALGAAMTIVIFVILAIISAIGFRFTKRLEDIYGGL